MSSQLPRDQAPRRTVSITVPPVTVPVTVTITQRNFQPPGYPANGSSPADNNGAMRRIIVTPGGNPAIRAIPYGPRPTPLSAMPMPPPRGPDQPPAKPRYRKAPVDGYATDYTKPRRGPVQAQSPIYQRPAVSDFAPTRDRVPTPFPGSQFFEGGNMRQLLPGQVRPGTPPPDSFFRSRDRTGFPTASRPWPPMPLSSPLATSGHRPPGGPTVWNENSLGLNLRVPHEDRVRREQERGGFGGFAGPR
ncbi:hypothetical protein CALVIDRAFT_557344 [Calocera viscosa TUFC12733]|uniref:Uncharacterized protein n=1 Tax=Calocera viscosa (strain TUFC12733) TaxID=1330018 RepID=A0A167IL14_CALVF|nr:hypothetical protein CALVIDRAFT_557344 [Calocera viscosa TUFC12733]